VADYDYGYRIIRQGGNTVLTFDTRSVSKIRGLLLIGFSGIFGVFFLMLAVTSKNDRILASAIFLFSLICIVGSVYLVRKRVRRSMTFTPVDLLIDGDGTGGLDIRSYDLAHVESFSSYRETLTMKYGIESVRVLRRVPNVGEVKHQAELLLTEHKHLNANVLA
jgi:hypothetical protein